MKLSCLMTVYNEESFIEYAIESCLPYVDHLVVVEGAYQETIKLGATPHSTDNTDEIIKKIYKINGETKTLQQVINDKDLCRCSTGMDMDAKGVYVSDEKGSVLAFDRSNGSSLWKQDKLSMRGLSRPLVLGRHLVVADSQGIVHLLNREDGSFVARFAGDGSAIFADPQRFKDGFVVQTRNGGIFALSVK